MIITEAGAGLPNAADAHNAALGVTDWAAE